jgi:hypothetical protein
MRWVDGIQIVVEGSTAKYVRIRPISITLLDISILLNY